MVHLDELKSPSCSGISVFMTSNPFCVPLRGRLALRVLRKKKSRSFTSTARLAEGSCTSLLTHSNWSFRSCPAQPRCVHLGRPRCPSSVGGLGSRSENFPELGEASEQGPILVSATLPFCFY